MVKKFPGGSYIKQVNILPYLERDFLSTENKNNNTYHLVIALNFGFL